MFCQLVFQKYFKLFSLQKERNAESYIAMIFHRPPYLDTFPETSKVPDQAVAVGNLGEQGPGSNSEVVFLSDPTTIQQCIVGDVVSSGTENAKKARNQEF